MSTPTEFDGWVSVFESDSPLEAEIVRDRLDDAGIPAVLLSKADSAFAIALGDAGHAFVLSPPDHEAEARALLAETISEAELEAAAAEAHPLETPTEEENDTAF